jgi:hypothetical protein
MFAATQRRKNKTDAQEGLSSASGSLNDLSYRPATTEQSADLSQPSYLICSITGELMQQPAVISCGHLFERNAIVQLLNSEVRHKLWMCL